MWGAGLELLGLGHAWGAWGALRNSWAPAGEGLGSHCAQCSGESQNHSWPRCTWEEQWGRGGHEEMSNFMHNISHCQQEATCFSNQWVLRVHRDNQCPGLLPFGWPSGAWLLEWYIKKETSSSSLYCPKVLILILLLKKPTYSVPTPSQPWKKIDIYIILVTLKCK